jgi:hypothetical protein
VKLGIRSFWSGEQISPLDVEVPSGNRDRLKRKSRELTGMVPACNSSG